MATETYDAKDITVLEGLDPVRKRPGMYIGGVGKDGLHHLLWELVDNAVDEAMNGYASLITVTIHADGCSATVGDNGRGIPVDLHPKYNKSALELILTTLHAGGKFDNKLYETSGGLHGVGASVVNALSQNLVATVKRDTGRWVQEYKRGKPVGPVKKSGSARGTGTAIYFVPDPGIFEEVHFDVEEIADRLETKAYLNGGLKIAFKDETSGNSHTFQHDGGVADLIQAKVANLDARPTVNNFFVQRREENGFRLEAAICWTDLTREQVSSYVNTIPTPDGGTHENGFRDAVVKAVRSYVDTHDLSPRGVSIGAEDIREGVVGVVSTFVPDPQFQGQTKDRLNNPDARGIVDGLFRPDLEQWFHEHASVAEAIIARIISAARARAASRAAATQVRSKASVSHRLNLPGKLADCSSTDPSDSELFIVEGDSAGGSAKQGRDRRTQAVLPLRGKVLNAEQANLSKVLANKELNDVVKALGCGMGDHFDISRLRYHRIILLMDADSDGHHIATLLLTFLYRYLPELINSGHVYLAQPPLFRIIAGKQTQWALTEREKERILHKLRKNVNPEITRFKGLGEMMPGTLYRTTMDPALRSLLQVTIREGEALETDQTISDLMGKDVSRRFNMIMGGVDEVQVLDV
ncbi:MAG TPA: DNA topoisomerase IV subunit B [Deltaproteobacteria bacterium]|nr:DNA topoisomerase IV subunit B [Deltaproteobacteria bacterium]HCP44895.1 DNA topoisomerase IV subunit B [Deltaproteobacteria bacterium]